MRRPAARVLRLKAGLEELTDGAIVSSAVRMAWL
jgi:hypothetical protein